MISTYRAAPGIDVVSSAFPIPGFGLVPVNAFVLHGDEPLLVDTGSVVEADEFMDALATVIDPMDLRWVWLTHTDFDHIGSLHRLLAVNPELKVLTSFLGVGALSLYEPLPMNRVHLVVPGERLAVAGRTLTALRPPTFDNPATVGFLDSTTGAYVSSDCFGALLQDVPTSAADLTETDLAAGQQLWATIDSPWLHQVDRGVLGTNLAATPEQEQSDLLFPSVTGGFRSPSVLNKPFADIADEIGLGKRFTQCGLRRTFNDLARVAQVNDVVTRSISGHLTSRMQDHYSTPAAEEKREGIARVIELARHRAAFASTAAPRGAPRAGSGAPGGAPTSTSGALSETADEVRSSIGRIS